MSLKAVGLLCALTAASLLNAGTLAARQTSVQANERRLTAARAWVSLSELRAHTGFFSSDALQGRAPGTQGAASSAQYIAAHFERVGLLPGGPDGSYFQKIPLLGIRTSPTIMVGTGASSYSLNFPGDFVARPERADTFLMAGGALTFVGYGINSPQHDWNDYKSAPLNGAVLLVLPGMPNSLNGNARLGETDYKVEEAVARGASGILFVHDSTNGLRWPTLRNRWTREFVRPLEARSSGLDFTGWITHAAAKRIFADADIDWDVLVRRASLKEFRPVDVGSHATVDLDNTIRSFEASNVIGTIRGSEIPERSVLITANHDYLGVERGTFPDSVYNGARANAANLSALLTMAGAISEAGIVSPTSLTFVATTAGESGALGLQSFIWGLSNTRESLHAGIVFDEANLWGPTAEIVVEGPPGMHEDALTKRAAAGEGLNPVPRGPDHGPRPTNASHAANILSGARVPFVALGAGSVLPDDAPSARPQAIRSFYQSHFGRITDNFLSEFDFRGLQAQVRVAVRLAWELAQVGATPTN